MKAILLVLIIAFVYVEISRVQSRRRGRKHHDGNYLDLDSDSDVGDYIETEMFSSLLNSLLYPHKHKKKNKDKDKSPSKPKAVTPAKPRVPPESEHEAAANNKKRLLSECLLKDEKSREKRTFLYEKIAEINEILLKKVRNNENKFHEIGRRIKSLDSEYKLINARIQKSFDDLGMLGIENYPVIKRSSESVRMKRNAKVAITGDDEDYADIQADEGAKDDGGNKDFDTTLTVSRPDFINEHGNIRSILLKDAGLLLERKIFSMKATVKRLAEKILELRVELLTKGGNCSMIEVMDNNKLIPDNRIRIGNSAGLMAVASVSDLRLNGGGLKSTYPEKTYVEIHLADGDSQPMYIQHISLSKSTHVKTANIEVELENGQWRKYAFNMERNPQRIGDHLFTIRIGNIDIDNGNGNSYSLKISIVACYNSKRKPVQLTEEQAREWLAEYNARAPAFFTSNTETNWYSTAGLNIALKGPSLDIKSFIADAVRNASMWDYNNFTDEMTKREFSVIVKQKDRIWPDDIAANLNELLSNLSSTFISAKVCNRPGGRPNSSTECFPLNPDLENIVAKSRNWNELIWAFDGWRNETGRKMPDIYEEFVRLRNGSLSKLGYTDIGAWWRSWFEMEDLEDECERLWQQVLPLYKQFHAYVRRKLKEFYVNEADKFPSTGHIPAHILGNVWAQAWENIEPIVRPFINKSGFDTADVTEEMKKQGYDVLRIFKVAEDFFTSIGLTEMPEEFWNKSMIVKPPDRLVDCHAAAWDFSNGIDFRISQCTEVTHAWLMTTHHEMGHIEYYLQYKHLPIAFREGANPAFHEAIGDVIGMSVSTPDHLRTIGLLPNYEKDQEVDLNFLMNQALEKVAFLPFGYLIDKWRWDLFAGNINRTNYNRDWWNKRCFYQGIAPPVGRLATDFDAGSKYHVAQNVAYVQYFLGKFLEYQIQKALCVEAGYSGPLHHCDIYNSTAAGKLLADMMKLGSSKPWPDVLEALTGSRKIEAEPLLEYFQPLFEWLTKENAGHPVGWDSTCPDGTIIDS